MKIRDNIIIINNEEIYLSLKMHILIINYLLIIYFHIFILKLMMIYCYLLKGERIIHEENELIFS